MLPDATYRVIGLMSGSSLDGLDIVYATITAGDHYSFQILAAETFSYDDEIKNFLSDIDIENHLQAADDHFAELTSRFVSLFIDKHHITHLDFIASHGHTVFHYPEKGITCQIGNGKVIAENTGYPVLSNFRQKDMDAGGQGAPLVPLCDELFFHQYTACLNIGGIANISFRKNEQRIGFDICAANQLLNFVAAENGMHYDEGGKIAASGKINEELFSELNRHPFFWMSPPKSLDNNRIKKEMISFLQNSSLPAQDKLATATEHIALQVARVIRQYMQEEGITASAYNLLVTGGGAYNQYLITRIEMRSGITIELPSPGVIEFKEALAMCLMGVRRWRNEPNFLPSVTGATHEVSGGDLFLNHK